MKYIFSFVAIVIILLIVVNIFTKSNNSNDVTDKTNIPEINIENVEVSTNGENTKSDLKVNKINKDNMTEQNNQITKAILKTNQGDITLELNPKDAPNTVANFVRLAKEGFYDGVKFHRVIKGFMIQGGDPLSKDDSQQARWGTGGPGYTFADEIHANNKNDKYTISMANAGPDTNGSQFFINTNDNNFLDTKHTVFGKVIAGTDVVDKIESTPTGEADRPLEPMVIESIVFE